MGEPPRPHPIPSGSSTVGVLGTLRPEDDRKDGISTMVGACSYFYFFFFSFSFVLFCFVFQDKISRSIPGCPGTRSVL